MELGLDKYSTKQKIIGGIILGLGFLYTYYTYLVEPLYYDITGLEQTLAQKRAELARAEELADKEAILKKELEILKGKLSEAKQVLPTEKEVAQLLDNLSRLAVQTGIKIQTFVPRSEQDQGEYVEVPIAITGMGDYRSLGVFLGKLTELPRLVKVLNVSITGNPNSPSHTLTFNMSLSTYRVGS